MLIATSMFAAFMQKFPSGLIESSCVWYVAIA